MRKGVFARLSKVVIILSLLSFGPVLYLYYVNTVPYAYLYMDDLSSKTGLICVPLNGDKSVSQYDYKMYSDQGKLPVDRYILGVYIGRAPDMIISKVFLQSKYNNLNLSDNYQRNQNRVNIDFDKLKVESESMYYLKKLLASEVYIDEKKYVTESVVIATTFTIICPLLMLAIIRMLMFLYSYIFYGRKDKLAFES
jgi:hypothetical protein